LTEDSLSVLGFRVSQKVQLDNGFETQTSSTFTNFISDPQSLNEIDEWWSHENAVKIRELNSTLFQEALASCTEVTYVNDTLVGDPLDVNMFKCSNWRLQEQTSKN
jgi:hypothetical protein